MGNYFLGLTAKLEDYAGLKNEFAGIIEGRWMPEENLHATLYFFGRRFRQRELTEQLEGIDYTVEPSLIRGLGYFGRHKILYAESANPSLEALHNRIAALFGEAQQPFIPHITLMRGKKIPDVGKLYDAMERCADRELGMLDSSVALIKSTPLPTGAQYRVVKRLSR